MLDESDASLFYALMRFEEAALALRAALKLGLIEIIGDDLRSLEELQAELGFTHQGARTYLSLLVTMRVLEMSNDRYRVSSVAKTSLSCQAPTTRAPYLSMGMGDDVHALIRTLRGESGETPPLYGEEGGGETLMDSDEVGSAVAHGLSSRARNFATPLADAIQQVAAGATSLADIGAGSPFIADACLTAIPELERAILVDRSNGMRFAREITTQQGIDASKMEFCERDFFVSVPVADVYCISNTAHDWQIADYRRLMEHVRAVIPGRGIVCIHEPLLQTSWSDSREWLEALWMACYALTLFKLTAGQGSCYTSHEHDSILRESGFTRICDPVRTRDGCTALFYRPIE